MGSRRIPALLSYGVVASVLFVLNCSHGAAGLGDFGLGDCPCTRGLFPVCSTTSGAFVSTSADCAEKCSGVSDVVECMFLRYYSWRGQCACTMYIPDRFGGWCNKETGAIASRDEACSKCRGMPDDMYADCDALPGGVSPRLIPDEELLCTDCKPACDGAVEEPQCSMATGQMAAPSHCAAEAQGMKFVMPCRFFWDKHIKEGPMIYDSCLFGDDMVEQRAGVAAGYAGCMAVKHQCLEPQALDGAVVQILCDPSDICEDSAEEVAQEWPECYEILTSGSAACSIEEANRIFDETVGDLCEPFGPADFPY